MENKSDKPKIDIALMQEGKPDLMIADLQTDLPSDKIIDNQVKLSFCEGKEDQEFLCESIADAQKLPNRNLYFEKEKIFGFGTIKESKWFQIPNISVV